MKSIYYVITGLFLSLTSAVHATPWSLTVVDETDRPIAGAYVRVSSADYSTSQFLKTDQEGKVSGDQEPAAWSALFLGSVFIKAPGYAPAGGTLLARQHRVRLNKSVSVSGRVVDDRGKPLPNLRVTLVCVMGQRGDTDGPLSETPDFYLLEEEQALFAARSGEDGRYTIDNLPADGQAIISIADRPWQSESRRIALSADTRIPDLKTRPAAQVKGRFLDLNGAPVAHRRVFAQGDQDNTAQTQTNADGSFALGGLKAGEVEIRLDERPGKETAVAPLVKAVVQEGVEKDLADIRLAPGGLIEIKVSPPVSGGSYTFRSRGLANYRAGLDATAKDGLVRALLRPGTYDLALYQPPSGWLVTDKWANGKVEAVAEEGKTTTVELTLQPALKIEGTARDEAGKPVAGVKIKQLYQGWPATTDAAGRFILDDLKPGELSVGAGKEWEVVKPTAITVPAPGAVDLVLRKVLLVPMRGRVVDDLGRPVAGASMTAEWYVSRANGGRETESSASRTNKDGRYEILHVRADAEVKLTAKRPRHRYIKGGNLSIERSLFSVSGAQIPNPDAVFNASDIVLQRLAAEASGRVVDAGGRPVFNALVAALSGGRQDYGVARGNITLTDEEGRFTLTDLPDGEIDFVAGQGEGYATARAAAGELKDIVLAPQKTTVRDLPAALELASAIAAKSGAASYDSRKLALMLGRQDFAAGLKLLRAAGVNGQAAPTLILRLFAEHFPVNPEGALAILPGLLPDLEGQDIDQNYTALMVAVLRRLPHPEKPVLEGEAEAGAAIRAWVHSKYAALRAELDKIDFSTSTDVVAASRLAGLSNLALIIDGSETAFPLVERSLQVAKNYEAANIEPGNPVAVWVVECLAPGGAAWAERGIALMPADQRAYALSRVITAIGKTDLPGARRLLDTVLQQEKPQNPRAANADPEYAFGEGARAIITRMTKEEAAAALELARRVTSISHRAECLALAARLQSPDQAAALFTEALGLAGADYNRTPASWIASVVLDSDEALGRQFLLKAEGDFISNQGEMLSLPWGASFADRAFYLARVEPGRARAWLEYEWARNLKSSDEHFGLNPQVLIATSMAAIDAMRARQMAEAIPPDIRPNAEPEFTSRWRTQLQIARYLAATEKERRDLRFDRWGGGSLSSISDE